MRGLTLGLSSPLGESLPLLLGFLAATHKIVRAALSLLLLLLLLMVVVETSGAA